MNNFLLLTIAILLFSCGKDSYPLLIKVEKLRTSKEASLHDFVSVHEHVALLDELLGTQIPKKVKLPSDTNCNGYTFGQEELEKLMLECQSGIFNVCPRGVSSYREKSEKFIKRCEELKEE